MVWTGLTIPARKNSRLWVVPLATLILVFLLGSVAWTVAAGSYPNEVLAKDDSKEYLLLFMGKDDELEVKSFTVKSGGPADVYVMESSEYTKYIFNETFTPVVAKESVNSTTFKWTQPDDGSYYLVVDNMNTSRANDAYSNETVTYDLDFDYTTKAVDSFLDKIKAAIVTIIVIFIVINVLILVFIYKDAEKRGKSGIGWLIFALLCGPIACLIWLLVRPPQQSMMGGPPMEQPPPQM